ncbi:MAG: hypothetical protein BJ554DRAFT_2902 [Olpidium bornovanus]|uniref:Uncharacterized protein n=1 Tax=Olpidium bornovanus TaxID=278681 RepID=A0A8H7ZQ99_9FUNG|nr:MAG: hypothetical protein BJ554DRAFT_2902 [Olpidium bornovanus]
MAARMAADTPRSDQPLVLRLEAALVRLVSCRGDILALMVILGQVTYAVNLMPHTLPAGYFDVLIRIHRLRDKYGAFTRRYLDLTREGIRELTVRPASDNRILPGTTSRKFVPRLFGHEAARREIGSLFSGGGRHDYVVETKILYGRERIDKH